MRKTEEGDLVLLLSTDRKKYLLRLDNPAEFQTHRGKIQHADLIGIPYGSQVHSHLGVRFALLRPTLEDLLLQTKRHTQIMYPKDIGYVLLRLSIGYGTRVLEAGTGSGALTTALAWSIGPEGQVFSYDRREDMQDLARRNLARIGLEERVTFHHRDIKEGFIERDIDAIFLDVPNPHEYLPQVRQALTSGGTLGVILPTTNQVTTLLYTLEKQGFSNIDMCEILLRFYRVIPARLRPEDRMVAHTGYLIFARPIYNPETRQEPVPESNPDQHTE